VNASLSGRVVKYNVEQLKMFHQGWTKWVQERWEALIQADRQVAGFTLEQITSYKNQIAIRTPSQGFSTPPFGEVPIP